MRQIVDTICREMADGVREEIRQAIMGGKYFAEYTKEYGDVVVMVRVRSFLPYISCVVSHYDGCHNSPRLEQVIENAMPDWYSIEREIASELRYSLTDDEIAMRLC